MNYAYSTVLWRCLETASGSQKMNKKSFITLLITNILKTETSVDLLTINNEFWTWCSMELRILSLRQSDLVTAKQNAGGQEIWIKNAWNEIRKPNFPVLHIGTIYWDKYLNSELYKRTWSTVSSNKTSLSCRKKKNLTIILSSLRNIKCF